MIYSVTCPINQIKKLILMAAPSFNEYSERAKKVIVEEYVKPSDVHTVLSFMEIKEITSKEASKIIEDRKPRGRFYLREKEFYVGIDNETGDAWTEEFKNKDSCIEWLMGEEGE